MKQNNLITSMTWFPTDDYFKEDHKKVVVTQVYCWIYTTDKKIVLVSKNSEKWQFPGGHPEVNETLMETLTREVLEETGLNLSKYSSEIKMFGYYLLKELNFEKLQTRFFIKIKQSSTDLVLEPKEKETYQSDSEKINFIKTVSINEACKLIPWLKQTEELQTFLSKVS